MSTISQLQAWYQSQCNEVWEHRYGIKIDTCDNPGWWVKIDLCDTLLAAKPYESVSLNVDSDGHQTAESWLDCKVTELVWEGAGDPTRLEEILRHFLDWANEAS